MNTLPEDGEDGALYESYLCWMEDMSKHAGRAYPTDHSIDFFAWLDSLQEDERARRIAEYRKGYAACLLEAEQSVAAVVAQLAPPQD